MASLAQTLTDVFLSPDINITEIEPHDGQAFIISQLNTSGLRTQTIGAITIGDLEILPIRECANQLQNLYAADPEGFYKFIPNDIIKATLRTKHPDVFYRRFMQQTSHVNWQAITQNGELIGVIGEIEGGKINGIKKFSLAPYLTPSKRGQGIMERCLVTYNNALKATRGVYSNLDYTAEDNLPMRALFTKLGMTQLNREGSCCAISPFPHDKGTLVSYYASPCVIRALNIYT